MSKLSMEEQIMADVDDELYAIKKKIMKKYKLSWEKARDQANNSLARLCCDCWNKKKMYGCGKK